MPAVDVNARIAIREATLDDAADLARLSGQLGYPSSREQIDRRLAQILPKSDHLALVACAPTDSTVDRLAGWIHAFVERTLESDPTVEIGGLVIDEERRGLGIGRCLIQHAERWARGTGAATVTVRSNVVRERAHSFYLRQGYTIVKSQHVFRKVIGE